MLILRLQYVHAGLQNLKMHSPTSLLGNYCYYLCYTFNKVQETLFSCKFIDTILLFSSRQDGNQLLALSSTGACNLFYTKCPLCVHSKHL